MEKKHSVLCEVFAALAVKKLNRNERKGGAKGAMDEKYGKRNIANLAVKKLNRKERNRDARSAKKLKR